MPTYQYACTECGHQLEAVQSFTDAALVECPECTGRLRKVFSAVGVVFKGSGFYRTDSRSKSSAGESAATSESTSTKTESTSTKSESASSTSSSSSSSSSSTSAPATTAA